MSRPPRASPITGRQWAPATQSARPEGRGGGRAVEAVNAVETDTHGAYQRIRLNQTTARPVCCSAWRRAAGVTGDVNSNYSLYLDIYCIDETPLRGQVLRFDVGNHDRQFRDGFIVPAGPIRGIYAYRLLRSTHTGTVWFNDIVSREVDSELVEFDRAQAAVEKLGTPPYSGAPLDLLTGNGLKLTLASDGGALTGVGLDGIPLADPDWAFASGLPPAVFSWQRPSDPAEARRR
jgi:hypothetical protein